MSAEFIWKDRKVLVTGGTGFLGKYVVEGLQRQGARLRVLDFRPPAEGENFFDTTTEFQQVDIRDFARVSDACQDREVVFHLAAIPSIARAKQNTYQEINVQGTQNVSRACEEKGVRKLVHVSSSTVYGIPSEFPLKENSQLNPIGKYGRSKIRAEEACLEHVQKGLSVSIIRPRVIMGRGRIGIFGLLFEQVINSRPVFIIGKGNNTFQFTAAGDMTEACLLAGAYPGTEIFNIGAEKIETVREELELLINRAGSASRLVCLAPWLARMGLRTVALLGISPLVDEQFMIADKDFKLDTTKAQRLLGWQPTQSNFDCLWEAYQFYREHKERIPPQFSGLFGLVGKFKHSQQGAFQRQKEKLE